MRGINPLKVLTYVIELANDGVPVTVHPDDGQGRPDMERGEQAMAQIVPIARHKFAVLSLVTPHRDDWGPAITKWHEVSYQKDMPSLAAATVKTPMMFLSGHIGVTVFDRNDGTPQVHVMLDLERITQNDEPEFLMAIRSMVRSISKIDFVNPDEMRQIIDGTETALLEAKARGEDYSEQSLLFMQELRQQLDTGAREFTPMPGDDESTPAVPQAPQAPQAPKVPKPQAPAPDPWAAFMPKRPKDVS